MRTALISALVLLAPQPSVDPCELEAVSAWNRAVMTSREYWGKRHSGIRDLKLRERMFRQFVAAEGCKCL